MRTLRPKLYANAYNRRLNARMHVLDTALITKRLEALLSVPPPSLPTPSSQHLDLMTPDAFTSSSQHNSPHSHLNEKYCVSSRSSDERHTTGWACYDTGHMRLM
ncbi:hypothetical protein M8J77_017155 [Diaphorina citri]|nr:hypothetical protein M8J77_017155 [Diaphorina citri]